MTTATISPPPTTDAALIARYASDSDQTAFAQLVSRHVDAVYAAARRQVQDPALAEDVTQAVFLVLARRADRIRQPALLSAWLMGVTRLTARDAIKARARRRKHERQAATMRGITISTPDEASSIIAADEIAPLLDEGLSQLKQTDQAVLVMRYLQQRSNAEIAAGLHISEAALRKRIERAIQRLRDFFINRGMTLSATSLSGAMGILAREQAPPALTSAIAASTGAAGSGLAGELAAAAERAMTGSKGMAALIAGATLIVAATAAVFVWTAGSEPPPIVMRSESTGIAARSDILPVIYTNDFTAGPDGFNVGEREFTPADNRPFLGQFGNETAQLRIHSLPPHDYLRVRIQLYILNTWDGSARISAGGGFAGPDFWAMRIDDRPDLVRGTFSNVPHAGWGFAFESKLQTYPAPIPSYPSPSGTGALAVNELGYIFQFYNSDLQLPMDAIYLIDLIVPHSDDAVVLSFTGWGLQPLNDEGWGLGNVHVEALGAQEVPAMSAGEVESAWADLIGDDPIRSREAFGRLLGGGDATVAFIGQTVQSAGINRSSVRTLASELAQSDAAARHRAIDALIAMGPVVEPVLYETISNPSPEIERAMRDVLSGIEIRPLTTPEERAVAGAVRLLQAMDTEASRELLNHLLDAPAGQSLEGSAAKSWREAFDAAYRLEGGEVLRYVPRPFPPERERYLADHRRGYERITDQNVRGGGEPKPISDGQSAMLLVPERTLPPLTPTIALPAEAPNRISQIASQMTWFARTRRSRDIVVSPDLADLELSGDWLVRYEASQADLMRDLERILREQTGRMIVIEQQTLPEAIIIVSGTFTLRREGLPPTDKPIIDVYIDQPDEQLRNPQESTLHNLLWTIQERIGTQLEIPDDLDMAVTFRMHRTMRSHTKPTAEQIDRLLKLLADQTGMTFKRGTTERQVYLISAAPAQPR